MTGNLMSVTDPRQLADDRARQTLRKFYLRARRIEAHSLMRPPHVELLVAHANGQFAFQYSPGEPVESTTEYPSEEAMESLAARVRPLILQSESVYHRKVIKAIRQLFGAQLDEEGSERLDQLDKQWAACDPSAGKLQAFKVQEQSLGQPPTSILNDSLLASGWFYLDVAHTDATGDKQAAEEFSLNARYEAAVPAFARIALTTVAVLRFLRELDAAGLLTLGKNLESLQVTVDPDRRRDVRVYVGPPNADPGELSKLPPDFVPLNLSHVLGSNPSRQARLFLQALDGSTTVHEAVIMHQDLSDDGGTLGVLVSDCLLLHIEIETDGQSSLSPEWRVRSNRQLASQLHLKADLAIGVSAQVVLANGLAFEASDTSDPDPAAHARLLAGAEFMDDIVQLERVAFEDFPLLDCKINSENANWAKWLRLLADGEVVPGGDQPVTVTCPTGESPAHRRELAGAIEIGNISIRRPEVIAFHPQAVSRLLGPDPDNPDLSIWELAPPSGGRWLMFAPEYRNHSEDLPPVPQWALMQKDEN